MITQRKALARMEQETRIAQRRLEEVGRERRGQVHSERQRHGREHARPLVVRQPIIERLVHVEAQEEQGPYRIWV